MNNTDRERLQRLDQILTSIPFSASGRATQTGLGAVMFEQDMRAIRPYISKLLQGMAMEGIEGFEVDIDYDDPDALLNALEKWVAMRKKEQWQKADAYSFRHIWEQ